MSMSIRPPGEWSGSARKFLLLTRSITSPSAEQSLEEGLKVYLGIRCQVVRRRAYWSVLGILLGIFGSETDLGSSMSGHRNRTT
jgi:hypothetical protein